LIGHHENFYIDEQCYTAEGAQMRRSVILAALCNIHAAPK